MKVLYKAVFVVFALIALAAAHFVHASPLEQRGAMDKLNKEVVRLGTPPLWQHGATGIVLGGHYILTARHVVENMPLYVQYYGDSDTPFLPQSLSKDPWGTEDGLDVGLLWVERTGGMQATIDCTPVWNGQRVILIGHPFLINKWFGAWGHVSRAEPNEYGMVALDIPVAPGDSGGAVFNEDGNIVGVLNAELNGTGYSFMIPSTLFCGVIEKASKGVAKEINKDKAAPMKVVKDEGNFDPSNNFGFRDEPPPSTDAPKELIGLQPYAWVDCPPEEKHRCREARRDDDPDHIYIIVTSGTDAHLMEIVRTDINTHKDEVIWKE